MPSAAVPLVGEGVKLTTALLKGIFGDGPTYANPEFGREILNRGWQGSPYEEEAGAMAGRYGDIDNPYIADAMARSQGSRDLQMAVAEMLQRRALGYDSVAAQRAQMEQNMQQNMLRSQAASQRSYNPAVQAASQRAVARVPSYMAAPRAAAMAQERNAANQALLQYLSQTARQDDQGRMLEMQNAALERKRQQDMENYRREQMRIQQQAKNTALGNETKEQQADVNEGN